MQSQVSLLDACVTGARCLVEMDMLCQLICIGNHGAGLCSCLLSTEAHA